MDQIGCICNVPLDAAGIVFIFWAMGRTVFPEVTRLPPISALIVVTLLYILDSYNELFPYAVQRKRQPLTLAVGLSLATLAAAPVLWLAHCPPAVIAQGVMALAVCFCPMLLSRCLLLRWRGRKDQAVRGSVWEGLSARQRRRPYRPLDRAVKQIFDRLAALFSLILLAPLFVAIAAVVKLDSPGPVFYRQVRYTHRKKTFAILKFRTMVQNAEWRGAQLATENDQRITRSGRFLRRLHLDELPQLVNILLGEMSFVGPRPERPVYADEYRHTVEHYEERYLVKAGLTGLAQVYGGYDTRTEDKIMLDRLYIDCFSLWLDIKLLIQTVLVVLLKEMPAGVRAEDARLVSDREIPAAEDAQRDMRV